MRSVLGSLRAVTNVADRTHVFSRQWLAPELAGGRQALGLLAGRADYFISNLKMVLRRGDRIMPGAAVTACYKSGIQPRAHTTLCRSIVVQS